MPIGKEGLSHRWSTKRIAEWYNSNPWLVGCNFVPSTAINQIEMWHRDTFDVPTISRELGWAAGLGFNTVRVFLHDLLWTNDREGFVKRIDTFLNLCQQHSIRVMFVIFDSVWDPFPEYTSRQPRKYVHNSGWVQSPGATILSDLSRHDELEPYVKDIITTFADDDRVLIWDLFNEPDNLNATSYVAKEPLNKSEYSMHLLQKVFTWAREVNPSQPLTAGLWYGDWSNIETMKAMDRFMILNSDLISFHNYDGPEEMEVRIRYLASFERPLVCTEYMARTFNSTFQNILPLFKKYKVGGYNWGFVDGKSQTSCPWDSWLIPYEAEPELWFHDIYRTDGTPYIEEEVKFLQQFTGQSIRTS